jgi:hypothetical protein
VRPVLVVMAAIDAEDVVEVAAAEDEDRSRQSEGTVRTQHSAWAFAFGAWIGVRITVIPSVRKISSKAWLNFVSREQHDGGVYLAPARPGRECVRTLFLERGAREAANPTRSCARACSLPIGANGRGPPSSPPRCFVRHE